MLVIAHRGLPGKHGENSAGAVRAAFESGADWVEVDVRTTADGVPVLCHDPLIAGLEIAESSLSGIRSACSASGGSLDTLEDVLGVIDGGVNLEIKAPCPDPPGLARLMDDLLDRHRGEVLISSFFAPLLVAMRPHLERPYGLLSADAYDPGGEEAIARAGAEGFEAVVLQDRSIDHRTVGRADRLRVFAWDVQDITRVPELASFGVEGVIVDDLAGALRALDRSPA